MQRLLLLTFFLFFVFLRKSCLFSSWLPFPSPICFSWSESLQCHCRMRDPKLPMDGGKWSDTDTCTLPEQDCTCWLVVMDRSEALQTKRHIVSWTCTECTEEVAVSLCGPVCNSAFHQTAGLLEIHPVNPGSVVIRGAVTARFLCTESDGKLYSSVRMFLCIVDEKYFNSRWYWHFQCNKIVKI